MSVSLSEKVRIATSRLKLFARAVASELRRLNSARMNPVSLASMPPRDRRRVVKAALREHHSDPRRCC
jgi:hypothetical protein